MFLTTYEKHVQIQIYVLKTKPKETVLFFATKAKIWSMRHHIDGFCS
jgi:hypothetical protein